MNEINLIRSFRSEIPAVTTEEVEVARANMRQMISGRTVRADGPGRRIPRKALLAVAVAICVPSGYAVANEFGIGEEELAPAPAPSENAVAPEPADFPPGLAEQDKRDLMPTDPNLFPDSGAGPASQQSGR